LIKQLIDVIKTINDCSDKIKLALNIQMAQKRTFHSTRERAFENRIDFAFEQSLRIISYFYTHARSMEIPL